MMQSRMRAQAAALMLGALALPALAETPGACVLGARDVYRLAAPRVVEVVSLGIDPYRVGGRVRPTSGSGFFVEGGLVATNFHVVVDARTIAIIDEGQTFDAEVVGVDPTLDVALLRPVGRDPAEALPFAADRSPQIGDPVFAIGFPLGIGKSISAGIVSGDHRILPRTTSSWLSPYLQTDAAVSAGNSGGPLLDACGRVVGMITLRADAPGAENLGFAVPISILSPVLAALAETGKVSRPWHGLYGQMVSPLVLALMDVPFYLWEDAMGFLVETVEPGSAADRAGLQGGVWPMVWGPGEILLGGDIVTEVNGHAIHTLDDALAAVRGLTVGGEVRLTYLRDGEPFETRVTVEERPLLEAEIALYRKGR